MATPRTKRQFAGAAADPTQRQITSFFSSQASSDALPEAPHRHPILPANVQSNLLSVGMRVRKSVPEGYKTGGSSGFKLWTDNTQPSSIIVKNPPPATVRSTSRELLPFCGINKIGGMDTQPEFHYDDEDGVPALDAVPELTMSQESTDGAATAMSEPSRKRVFEEDGDSHDNPVQVRVWDGEVSPRSLAPVGWDNARAMAVPRSRLRKGAALKDSGQENMAVDQDFEDAEFLVFGEQREMDLTA